MDTNVLEEIEKLRRASLAELQARYREVFGEDTPLNLLFRQRHFNVLCFRIGVDYREGRKQHAAAIEPASRIRQEVADSPCFIVKIQPT